MLPKRLFYVTKTFKVVTTIKENTVTFDYKESCGYGEGYLYCIF